MSTKNHHQIFDYSSSTIESISTSSSSSSSTSCFTIEDSSSSGSSCVRVLRKKWTHEEEEALKNGVQRYGEGRWVEILNDDNYGVTLRHRDNIAIKDKWRSAAAAAAAATLPKKRNSNTLKENEQRGQLQEEQQTVDSVAKRTKCSTTLPNLLEEPSNHSSPSPRNNDWMSSLHKTVQELSFTNKDMEALCILPAFQHMYHRYCHIEANLQQLLHRVTSKDSHSIYSPSGNHAIATTHYCEFQQDQQLQQSDEDYTTTEFKRYNEQQPQDTSNEKDCIPNLVVGPSLSFTTTAEEEKTAKVNSIAAEEEKMTTVYTITTEEEKMTEENDVLNDNDLRTKTSSHIMREKQTAHQFLLLKNSISHTLFNTSHHRGKRDRVPRKSFP